MYAAEVIYKAKFKRFKVMGVENTSYRPRVSIHYSAIEKKEWRWENY